MNLTSNAHTGRRDSRKLKSYYFNPTLKTQKNELSEEKLMLTPVSCLPAVTVSLRLNDAMKCSFLSATAE